MNEQTTLSAFNNWLQQRQNNSASRQLVIIAGASQAEIETPVELCCVLHASIQAIVESFSNTLYVGNFSSNINAQAHKRILPSQLNQHLGQQCDALILDCRDGLHANVLYSAVGLVEAKGLLVLIAPVLSQWSDYYARHTAIPFSFGEHHTYSNFADYLRSHFQQDSNVAYISPTHSVLPIVYHDQVELQHKPTTTIQLSAEQLDIIQAIEESWTLKNHSCHFIGGARGRGKTTLLSELCLRLVQNKSKKEFSRVAICAPSAQQRDVIMRYVQMQEQDLRQVVTIAPDQEQQLAADMLLIIDEAASIAPDVLTRLCQCCDHKIVCGTTQGYEGSGKGLIRRWLPALGNSIMQHALSTPMRWSKADVLEPLFDDIFSPLSSKSILDPTEHYQLILLEKTALLKNMELTKACIALLQQAHYQSTPSDVQRMLDSNDHRIWAYTHADKPFSAKHLIGVVCTIVEDGPLIVSKDGLARDIASGKRRLQGLLSLQALALGLNTTSVFNHKICRIHRIAISPSYQKQSLGSKMLSALNEKLNADGIHNISTAFGMTEALTKFWQKNQFTLVKLGQRIDTSSAAVTGHFLHTKSPLLKHLKTKVSGNLILDREYIYGYQKDIRERLPTSVFDTILSNASDIDCNEAACKKLELFVTNQVSYAMARTAVFYAVKKLNNDNFQKTFNKLHKKHLSKETKNELTVTLKRYCYDFVMARQKF